MNNNHAYDIKILLCSINYIDNGVVGGSGDEGGSCSSSSLTTRLIDFHLPKLRLF